MDILDRLSQAGVDVSGSLSRFSGNEALYLRFIRKFPQDPNFNQLVDAVKNQDCENALVHAHTLKGLCANLGMDELSNACNEMVKRIRAGETDSLKDSFAAIQLSYQKMLAAVEE